MIQNKSPILFQENISNPHKIRTETFQNISLIFNLIRKETQTIFIRYQDVNLNKILEEIKIRQKDENETKSSERQK